MSTPGLGTFDSDFDAALFALSHPYFETALDPTVKAHNVSDKEVREALGQRLDRQLARSDLLVELVKERTTEDERKSFSTATVVRDMKALFDRLGEPSVNLLGYSYGRFTWVTFFFGAEPYHCVACKVLSLELILSPCSRTTLGEVSLFI